MLSVSAPPLRGVNKVRFIHAGCGVNALSGLHRHVNLIYCRYRVGLISVAHQALFVCYQSQLLRTGRFSYSLISRLALFGLNAATTSGAVSTYGPSSN
ncbi:hypothetical protein EYW98_14350 [Escherichia coli]|nr:hypothetical protein [Escherichia coli]EGO8376503.1 hypothetical protein [Escherichia coli]